MGRRLHVDASQPPTPDSDGTPYSIGIHEKRERRGEGLADHPCCIWETLRGGRKLNDTSQHPTVG
jgi:hypothetical protein